MKCKTSYSYDYVIISNVMNGKIFYMNAYKIVYFYEKLLKCLKSTFSCFERLIWECTISLKT